MGGTLNLSFNVQATAATGSNLSETIPHSGQCSVTMTGAVMFKKTFIVPTSAAAIDFGSISGAPAFMVIVNRDATNYIEVGGDSGLTVFKFQVNPNGIPCVVPLPNGGTVFWKAHTSTVEVTLSAYSA